MNLKRSLTFKLATPDTAVQRMIIERGHKITLKNDKFDALVFCGGVDIHPFIYGQKKHKQTRGISLVRDMHELKQFRKVPKHFPKIGICRGAQLLNCLSGGSLFQHVDGHGGSHDIWECLQGQIMRTTSVHHQMMVPTSDAFIIASAQESRIKEDDEGSYEYTKDCPNDWDDPEIVYYDDTKSLCVQGHPEYQAKGAQFQEYFWDLVETFYFPDLYDKPETKEEARAS